MSEATKAKTCRKVRAKQYDEARIEIRMPWAYWRNEKWRADEFKDWSAKVLDFIRDHRSQDAEMSDVEVIVPEFDACSVCGEPWETCEFEESPEGPAGIGCANCGAMLEHPQPKGER